MRLGALTDAVGLDWDQCVVEREREREREMCLLEDMCQWLAAWWPCRVVVARFTASLTAVVAAAERSKHHGMIQLIQRFHA